MKIITLIIALCVSAMAQQHEITWGCALRPATDKVSDTWTLDCKEKADETKTFILDIPKPEWPEEWSLGQREFYYGTHIEGKRFAIKTPPTFCDTEYLRGNQIQSQLCGVMFRKEQ